MIARFAPHSMLERKAPHGQPCTSCGLCCHVALCDLSAAIYDKPKDAPGPCPALQWVDGKSRCGVLVEPTRYSPRAHAVGPDVAIRAAEVLLFPGEGCDMSMTGDIDEGYRLLCLARDAGRRASIRWALRVWGMTTWARKHRVSLAQRWSLP